MKDAQITKVFDSLVGPSLERQGFRRDQPAVFVRDASDGRDKIGIDITQGSRVSVMLSYLPNYLLEAYEALTDPTHELGFPVGPYLTPAGVFARPRFWIFKDVTFAQRSASQIVQALEACGMPWLTSLRDPLFYVHQVFHGALLVQALAMEQISEYEGARAAYGEILRRKIEILHRYGDFADPYSARVYVYVAHKLGRDIERRTAIAERVGYHPDVKPLPEA